MPYANVNGLNLYYETHGSGEPLVALHGGLHTFDLSFRTVLPWLTTNRQVIGVELQGHGHTADSDRPLTLPNFASDVVALLDELGIERADMFGYSLGGLTALQAAMSTPDRVGRLVLAGCNFRSTGNHDDIRDPAQWATSTRMPTEVDFQQMLTAYHEVAPDPDHFQAFMANVSQVPDTVDNWSLDALRAVTAPTLLVIGDHDFVRVAHAEEMHELIPNSQLAVLPGTTHMGLMRHSLLGQLVQSFLG